MSNESNPTQAAPEPRSQKPQGRAISAREKRKQKSAGRLIMVAPGEWWRVRRVDMMSLIFEKAIPTPLLNAVDELQKVRVVIGEDGDLAKGVEMMMRSEKFRAFKDVLRAVAVKTVMEPRLTDSKKAALANEDLLWVGGDSDIPEEMDQPNPALRHLDEPGDVEFGSLMTVWKYLFGESGIVIMEDDEAATFRPGAEVVSRPAVSDVERVRAEAVVVDGEQPASPNGSARKVSIVSA